MKADLERAIGLALGAQAEYLLMASEAEDKQAKQVFEAMAEDVDRHVKVLRSRQEYLQKWGSQLQQQQALSQQAGMGAQGGQAQMMGGQGGAMQQQGGMAQAGMQQGMMGQPAMQQGTTGGQQGMAAQQPMQQQMAQQPMQQQMGQHGGQPGSAVGTSGAGATSSGSKG